MLRADLFVAAATLSLALGCESTPSTGSSASGGATANVLGSTPSQESPTGGVVTVADGFQIVHDDWAHLGYQWDWSSRPFISPRGTLDAFTPLGDLLIARESGSSVTVMESRSGRVLWTTQLGSRFTKFVGSVRDNDLILTSTASESIELGATSGNIVAKSRFRFLVDSPPVLFGSLAIYASESGKLLAHNRDAGVGAWAYALSGPIESPPVMIGDSIVSAVSRGGDVIFLDPITGSSVGRAKISGGVTASPVADTDRLYIASHDQSIYAFDALGGELAWRVRTEYPILSQPTIHDGILYLSLRGHGLSAFDTIDGSLLWRTDEINGTVIGVRNGELVVSDGAALALVDTARGDIIRRHDFPGAVSVTTDTFVDGAIYVVGRSGIIVRFVPRS